VKNKLTKENGWISVKDAKPDINNDEEYNVLCHVAKYGDLNHSYDIIILGFDDETRKWVNNNDDYDAYKDDYENNPDYVCVTHWMKLPKPPRYYTDEEVRLLKLESL